MCTTKYKIIIFRLHNIDKINLIKLKKIINGYSKRLLSLVEI